MWLTKAKGKCTGCTRQKDESWGGQWIKTTTIGHPHPIKALKISNHDLIAKTLGFIKCTNKQEIPMSFDEFAINKKTCWHNIGFALFAFGEKLVWRGCFIMKSIVYHESSKDMG